MDFDGFIQIVVGLGALVFWMFGASKKKHRPGQEPSGEPPAPEPLPPQLTETEKLIREALGIVDDRLTIPESVAQPEARPAPKTTSRARVTSKSAERIVDPLAYKEVKAEARRDRFLQRRDQPKTPVRKRKPKQKNSLGLDVGSMRSAIVWREILGPPKSLE